MKFSALKSLPVQVPIKKMLRSHFTEHQPNKSIDFVQESPIPFRYRKHLLDGHFWDEFREFADKTGALNLGEENQWCHGCDYTRKQLQKFATKSSLVQDTRSAGHPRLCQAVAAFYDGHLKLNPSSQQSMKKIDPLNEILITNGSQEAIFVGIMSFLDKDDEVVVFEPFKSAYVQVAKEAGAKIRYVPLKPDLEPCSANNWKVEEYRLKKMVGPRTKMVILNNPQFPLGKNWSRNEMDQLLFYLQKYNIMVLCDETQDFLSSESQHVHLCTQKGFWERTLTILDVSDMFGLPGWNIACLYGPEYFISKAQSVHQCLTYACPTQIQEALAAGLEREFSYQKEDCTFSSSLVRGLDSRRKILYESLYNIGFLPIWPESGYWMVTNWRPVSDNCDIYFYKDDYEDFKFNKWLSYNMKFQGIPVSPFYCQKHKHYGEEYIAFCFLNEMKRLCAVRRILQSSMEKQFY